MKKLLLLPMFAFFAGTAFSQVTITASDFANIGDRVVFYTDTAISVSLGSTGSGQTWDFSSFTPDLIDSLIAIDPASTPDAAMFPNSNLAIEMNGGIGYLNKTSTGVKTEGFAGNLMGFANGAVQFNPPQTMIEFPSSMGSSFTSNSSYISPAIPFGYNVPCVLGSFNIDSARTHHSSQLSVTFDAEGSLGIPTGIYNTVRSYSIDKTTDTIYIYSDAACILFGVNQGWQVAPTALMQLAGFGSNPLQDTTYTYSWWAEGEIYSVASIGLDDSGQPGYADYNAKSPLSIENPSAYNFTVYPNPTSDIVYINTGGEKGFYYNVYDLSGRLHLGGQFNNSSGIDMSSLVAGHYILKLEKAGKLVGTVHLTKH